MVLALAPAYIPTFLHLLATLMTLTCHAAVGMPLGSEGGNHAKLGSGSAEDLHSPASS